MKNSMRRKVNILVFAGVLLFFPLQINAMEVVTQETISEEITETTEEAETKSEEATVSGNDVPTEPEVKVNELDLGDYSDKMTVGEKQLLSVTVLPLNASDATITYSSSNTDIATISGMGRITAVTIGKTIITVTAGEVSQSFELQVTAEEDTNIHVTDIEIGEHESELEVGKTLTLSGTVIPSNATNSTITYKSSNPTVATVSSTGVVKGIGKGDVVITLSADGVSKNVSLTVKVATIKISLNKDYLVLKTGERYQLSANVTPAEANQVITYHSVDTSIATVSQVGFVTAKGTGSTTIIVSNGDTSVAVSVIVNESIVYQEKTESNQAYKVDAEVYPDLIYAVEQKVINSEMLRYLYETKQVLRIIGNGYIIEIDGKDIVNYDNEFFTDIELANESGKTSFLLNKGNELCGAVTVYLEETNGRYLYLYNVSEGKYELLSISDITELKLTTAGEYLLCETKMKLDKKVIVYTVIGSVILLLIGGMIYIFVKKKYWFW